jgi:DeoR family transcriptional regulator, fructose operon transcriptional repressor
MVRLIGEGVASAEALATQLDVSLSTVRRDLARLACDGALLRTYGGAALAGPVRPEQPLAERLGERNAQKAAIAALAAEQVRDGQTIILDAGSTVGALAERLRERASLRVITSGLTSLQALAGQEGIELVSLGGTLRPISLGFTGPLAEQAMRRMTADSAFLGADGVVAGRGLCEATQEQAALKEAMIAQAGTIIVMVTSDKLGYAASQAWAPLDRPWTLITDTDATDMQLEPFRALSRVTVLLVPPLHREPENVSLSSQRSSSFR